MQDVRVAAVQMDSPVAEKERNLDAVARLAQAADLGAYRPVPRGAL